MKNSILIWIVAGLIAYKALSKVGEKFGLVDSANDKALEKNLSNKWLTPEPFKKFVKDTGFKIPSVYVNFVVPGLVNKIWEAKGFFNDDESSVYDFFRALQSKRQVSALAYYFEKEHPGRALNSYLESFMNSDEIAKVSDIIKTKPDDVTGFYIYSGK